MTRSATFGEAAEEVEGVKMASSSARIASIDVHVSMTRRSNGSFSGAACCLALPFSAAETLCSS